MKIGIPLVDRFVCHGDVVVHIYRVLCKKKKIEINIRHRVLRWSFIIMSEEIESIDRIAEGRVCAFFISSSGLLWMLKNIGRLMRSFYVERWITVCVYNVLLSNEQFLSSYAYSWDFFERKSCTYTLLRLLLHWTFFLRVRIDGQTSLKISWKKKKFRVRGVNRNSTG